MASLYRAYRENVGGNFFVDETCIDCDLCRQIAPSVFREDFGHSIVYEQPESAADIQKAGMALVTCPTGSIGTREHTDLGTAVTAYPELIEENVYFCGFASRESYGAASYFIHRPEGNVLVDSPRFAGKLVRQLERLGGVSMMFLTHRDDVADHEKYHDRFDCSRIIHGADSRGIASERLLKGQDPVAIAPDLLTIPVPGHTRGHAVLLYRNKYLFTGDHLAWDDESGTLEAFRNVCWYSWSEQTRSMSRLLDFEFEWVLPGHGRRGHRSAPVMRQKLIECVEWMKRVA